jgi:16S rRNA (adenine(1408)-N(1))-methyltransferase
VYSSRAARKPSRGGAPNTLFTVASLESLPCELSGLAGHLTVHFPWGSLLRAVALPDPDGLAEIARLCRPGADLEVTLSYDPRDTRIGELGLPLTAEHVADVLPGVYREAGFRNVCIREMTAREAAALPTTWAKRLAYGRPRLFWRLTARAGQ